MFYWLLVIGYETYGYYKKCSIFSPSSEITQNEFIVPMSVELKELYEDPSMGNSMKSLAYESIRPQMLTTEIRWRFYSITIFTSKYYFICIRVKY